MLVIIKNTPVELPELEAEILLRWGAAHLPELADLPMPNRYESSGTPTPRSRQQATEPKHRKSSKGSPKNTK
jgi:hypothetical protein